MKTLIVYDSDHPLAVNNECFKPQYASQGAGYFFWSALYNEAIKNNMVCVTGDIFLKQVKNPKQKVFCISELHTRNTDKIIKRGAIPIICYSLESPLMARSFYYNIEKYSGKFLHSYNFEGVRKKLENTHTQFHTIYFPVHSKSVEHYIPWHEKKFLVIINSNKRAFYNKSYNIKSIIHSFISRLRYNLFKLIAPWNTIRELYVDRIDAIRYFSKFNDFHLYGRGWDDSLLGFGQDYQNAVKKSWKGPLGFELETKFKTMGQFKFSICFENCNFPGYITEKIFDCFLSGCIPIYYGAPDISNFIPEDTYIDYRQFRNMEDLNDYLQKMNIAEAEKYLKSAEKFLQSRAFDLFFVENITQKMIRSILNYRFDK